MSSAVASVESRVITLIADYYRKHFNDEPGKISPGHDLVADLCFDSLSVMEILVAVEEEFGINIPELLLDEISTVRNLVECIDQLLSKKDN
ncbi:MAG: phosphopantetheine-binding protein [Patescibacteria group bacterium]